MIPEFGTATPGIEYSLRPGGYVVILNGAGAVAMVSTLEGLALPGGGQNEVEKPEEAAIREAQEECGLQVALSKCIGVADELFYSEVERKHYRKRCTFFIGEVVCRSGVGEPDHKLLWWSAGEAITNLRHGSQRWAVAEACRLAGAKGL
jgi:ADP-ribose pyrophosphatase YjhB (NUDIX family)